MIYIWHCEPGCTIKILLWLKLSVAETDIDVGQEKMEGGGGKERRTRRWRRVGRGGGEGKEEVARGRG